ncbi:MAG: gamma-glutamyl-gamma-aminobutyrate hydrolase family protein [Anaerolineaceae bacterium]|nr:gamma-glutamyl-gamma-aminobutyrate hydrolase family protein [Anaerolineaceae bacterium]
MKIPVIGIAGHRDQIGHPKARVAAVNYYIEAILRAGGLPLIIPVGLQEDDLIQLGDLLDGLVITGGPDIDPAAYGEKMDPEVKGVDVLRDKGEIFLVRYAVQEKIPLLGICRGVQIINIAMGGSLYTHVSDQHPDAIHHTSYPDLPFDLLSHPVTLLGGSKLAEIFGCASIRVNSLHHQGIKVIPPDIKATAFAPDQLVEGIEVQDHPFCIGVQWHPEILTDNQHALALFRSFIQAAAS